MTADGGDAIPVQDAADECTYVPEPPSSAAK